MARITIIIEDSPSGEAVVTYDNPKKNGPRTEAETIADIMMDSIEEIPYIEYYC